MSDVDVKYSYTLGELLRSWKEGGWRRLAGIAEANDISPSGDIDFSDQYACETYRIREGLEEIWGDWRFEGGLTAPFDVGDLLILAAMPPGESYTRDRRCRDTPSDRDHDGTLEEDNELKRLMLSVLTALVESQTLEEALLQINPSKSGQDFLRAWSISDPPSVSETTWCSLTEPYWREILSWLRHGLRDRDACDEAYWNCVWHYAQATIDRLSEAERMIDADVPLTEELAKEIDVLLARGMPTAGFVSDCNGKVAYKISLEPSIPGSEVGLHAVARTLCVAPAFILAQTLERKLSTPRFIRTCRAPSCGKRFYTMRAEATSCPGSQGGKKNQCALEWIRYKRYLMKLGMDPEKDWEKPDLRGQFISCDQP